MREGWIKTNIGSAFHIQQGKTLAISKLMGGKYPVYGANGIVGYFDEFNFDFPVTGLGCRGSCGTIYYIDSKAFLANNVMAIWEKDASKIDSRYIPLALGNVDLIASGAISGQVQPQITKQGLEPVAITIPPLPEQKRIVDLISSVDSYIGALQQQLESAKRSRNAVLHEFMNGEGTAFEDTQLGQIAKFLNGKAYSKEELLAVGKYRVLRVGNFFSNNNWYWSDLELEPNKYCENGDLLYAWSASFGPRIWNEEKVIYHYHIWKVNPDESLVDKKWLFYWLEDDVERIKSASGSGSIMMHVTKSEMEKRAIRLPALSDQIRQLVILESFDQTIHTLETLIVSTSHLRSSMLSDLLSGIHEIPTSYDKVIGAA
jgi:type I restriction enzyme S subunit